MKFLFVKKPSRYGGALYASFKHGFEKFGHTVDLFNRENVTKDLIKKYDYTCLYTARKTKKVIKKIKKVGGSYIYFDRGYCRIKGVSLENPSAYIRISFNGWQPLKHLHKFEKKSDRWSKVCEQKIRRPQPHHKNQSCITLSPQPTKQEHEGSYILFAGSSEKYHESHGLGDPETYAVNVFNKLREHTDRPIIYRPKPSWSGKKPIPQTIYQGDAALSYPVLLDKDIYTVVTHTSNASLEANFYGIPTIVLGDAITKPLSSTKIEEINNIYRPSVGEKYKLGRALSYFQWTLAEIKNGTMWRNLKDIFEEELSNGS